MFFNIKILSQKKINFLFMITFYYPVSYTNFINLLILFILSHNCQRLESCLLYLLHIKFNRNAGNEDYYQC